VGEAAVGRLLDEDEDEIAVTSPQGLGELDRRVAQPTDADHGNPINGLHAVTDVGREGSGDRAQQRCRVF
jgi:hypothetical protein